jgi:hypothetical protein
VSAAPLLTPADASRHRLLSRKLFEFPWFLPLLSPAMNQPTVTGTVHLIEPTKTYGQKGFRKRLVVVEQTTGRFTNYLPMEFVQDNCDVVDQLNVGDQVEIPYRLTGRKWQRDPQSEVKFFLSAEAMGFEVLNSAGDASAMADEDGPPPFDPGNEEEPPF